MTVQDQLLELESLAQKLDVAVCYEPMSGLVQGIGGLCRVRGRYRIIMDRRLKPAERCQIVADALRRFDWRAVQGGELSKSVQQLLMPPPAPAAAPVTVSTGSAPAAASATVAAN